MRRGEGCLSTAVVTAACRRNDSYKRRCDSVDVLYIRNMRGYPPHAHLKADLAPAIMSFSICPVFLNHPSYSFGKVPDAPPKNMRTPGVQDVLRESCCSLALWLVGRNEVAKPWTTASRVATNANAQITELLMLDVDVDDQQSGELAV